MNLLSAEYRDLAAEYEGHSRYEWDGGTWHYFSDDGDVLYGIAVRPVGRFVMLTPFAVNWTQAEAEAHLLHSVRWYTTYGQRLRFAEQLKEFLGLDEAKANAMAIVLSQEDTLPPPYDYPTQLNLHGPVDPPPAVHDRERLFEIRGGGWLKVAYHGEQFTIRLSIPSTTGGYLHPFRGYINNEHTRRDLAAAAIFGWRNYGPALAATPGQDEAPKQGRLPGVDQGDDDGRARGDSDDSAATDPTSGDGTRSERSQDAGAVLHDGDGDSTLPPAHAGEGEDPRNGSEGL